VQFAYLEIQGVLLGDRVDLVDVGRPGEELELLVDLDCIEVHGRHFASALKTASV